MYFSKFIQIYKIRVDLYSSLYIITFCISKMWMILVDDVPFDRCPFCQVLYVRIVFQITKHDSITIVTREPVALLAIYDREVHNRDTNNGTAAVNICDDTDLPFATNIIPWTNFFHVNCTKFGTNCIKIGINYSILFLFLYTNGW